VPWGVRLGITCEIIVTNHGFSTGSEVRIRTLGSCHAFHRGRCRLGPDQKLCHFLVIRTLTPRTTLLLMVVTLGQLTLLDMALSTSSVSILLPRHVRGDD
jgi:hypothetical protein